MKICLKIVFFSIYGTDDLKFTKSLREFKASFSLFFNTSFPASPQAAYLCLARIRLCFWSLPVLTLKGVLKIYMGTTLYSTCYDPPRHLIPRRHHFYSWESVLLQQLARILSVVFFTIRNYLSTLAICYPGLNFYRFLAVTSVFRWKSEPQKFSVEKDKY